MAFASLLATDGTAILLFCAVRGVRAMQLRHRRLGLFWVKSRHFGRAGRLPVFPRKRTSSESRSACLTGAKPGGRRFSRPFLPTQPIQDDNRRS